MGLFNSNNPLTNWITKGNFLLGPLSPILSIFAPNLMEKINKAFGVQPGDEAIGSASQEIGNAASSWLNKQTGAHLTGAQLEENQFNADQAQIQRDWEERMANTSFQRGVKDLDAAGLNAALAYGGASAPTPNGATATAGNNNNGMSMSDLMAMLMLPTELEMKEAQIENINADTGKKEAETTNVATDTERTRTLIEGSKLDNEAKRIVNSYLDRMQEAELRIKYATEEEIKQQANMLVKQIDKMDYEELEIFIHCCEMQEEINLLIKKQALTDEEIKQMEALTYKLQRETKLINLNITNFDDITVAGNKSTSWHGPFGIAGSESHPMTLAEVKRHAEKERARKAKNADADVNYEGTRYDD